MLSGRLLMDASIFVSVRLEHVGQRRDNIGCDGQGSRWKHSEQHHRRYTDELRGVTGQRDLGRSSRKGFRRPHKGSSSADGSGLGTLRSLSSGIFIGGHSSCLCVCSCVWSLMCLNADVLIHSSISSFIHWGLHWCVCSVVLLVIHVFIHVFIHLFMCSFIHSFLCPFIHVFIHSCVLV